MLSRILNLSNTYFLFELLTLTLSIVYWKQLKKRRLGLFPYYMIIIVICEIASFLISFFFITNIWWINSFCIPAEFIFSMLICRNLYKKKIFQQLALLTLMIYIGFFVADIIFFKETYIRLYLRSYFTGAIGLLFIVVLYGYELLNSDELLSFYREPAFWICTGLLLFYIGTLPFHLTWNVASERFVRTFLNTKVIFYVLVCLMYLSFSIGVLCLKPKAK